MPNQRDVARLAGVSTASVSRYLANVPTVKAPVVKRIQAAIAELGYRVDQSAQTLKTGKSRHLAILAPATGPYFWQISSVLQAELDAQGYDCTLLYSRPQDQGVYRRSEVMEVLHRRQMDGALIFPLATTEDDELLSRLQEWGKPVVVLDRRVEGLKLPQVWVDNAEAGRRAAREILDRGHRNVLFVWGERSAASAQLRWQGFRQEFEREGIELGEDRQIDGRYYSHYTWAETQRRWDSLAPFTAVFCCNDSSAVGFCRAARERGLRCPEDFSLLGFDDHAEFSAFFEPPLATFRLPTVELATRGAQILLERLEDDSGPPEAVVLHAEFVPRASLISL